MDIKKVNGVAVKKRMNTNISIIRKPSEEVGVFLKQAKYILNDYMIHRVEIICLGD